MNRLLTWQLATRYLRGKRTGNAVPILSRISMVAICVCSAAMIVVFSVFNGLEHTVKGVYNAFYPDIKVTAARGKFFAADSVLLGRMAQVGGVVQLSPVIEDNVFASNHELQKVITLKGIRNDYFKVNNIQQYIIDGEDTVSDGEIYTAIAGMRILNELGSDVNALRYLMVYYPNPTMTAMSADPLSAFQSLRLHPAGVFQVQDDFDDKYVLAPVTLVQQLFSQQGKYSSVELLVEPGMQEQVKAALKQLLGSAYRVETRYEQNRTLYMVMGGEKWAIYAILVLVLLIASFNMVGALSMLVLEKQKDIGILRAMGALPSTIRAVFLLEGVLWALVGGLSGLFIGGGVSFIQQQFGLLKMGSAFVVDAYPVRLNALDFALVIATIIAVGLLAAWYPALKAAKAVDVTLKST